MSCRLPGSSACSATEVSSAMWWRRSCTHVDNRQTQHPCKDVDSLTVLRAPQLYLENSGKPGDLRVSEVYEGDPAVKGSIFVHQRT